LLISGNDYGILNLGFVAAQFVAQADHAYLLPQDGQTLFTALYRSWCHNPVAVFSLCLLAQAYEHASNLLPIMFVLMLIADVRPTHHSKPVLSSKSRSNSWCKLIS
jgi:hypothetical protein